MRIGAAWKKQSKNGKSYLSGVIQYPGMNLRVAIFPVDEKRSENSPDYDIVWSEERKGKEQAQEAPAVTDTGFDDDVPF